MDSGRFRAYIIVATMLSAALVVLAAFSNVAVEEGVGVSTQLPTEIEGYRAQRILYCQNEVCPIAVRGTSPMAKCPECGHELNDLSIAEKTLLPADTQIIRRRYLDAWEEGYTVTVVVSGIERRSIHRPEVCLVGQGFSIISRQVLDSPEGSPDMLLLEAIPTDGHSAGKSLHLLYCYWFVSSKHTTPSHFRRLFWTAWDAVVHNVRRRWAYVVVSAASLPADGPEARERLHEFALNLGEAITTSE